MEVDNRKRHIILVHGACHGAWCWYKLATLLRAAGHRVTVPDLAASGVNPRRLEELATFADYSQPLLEIMASLPQEEKVVLVGHSLGGLNIAMAMEGFPNKIALAVFVTAVVPECTNPPIYPIQQYYQKYLSAQLEWKDSKFDVIEAPGNRTIKSMLFGPQTLASKLYHLCPPEDLTLATTLVRPTSLFEEDLGSQPPLSKDKYGSVDSTYILCCKDLQLYEDFQRLQIQNHQVKEVIELEGADHMPMMSVPNELCKSLLDLVDRTSQVIRPLQDVIVENRVQSKDYIGPSCLIFL